MADSCFAPEGNIGICLQVNNLVWFQSTEKKSKYGHLF
ncbi:hypothetical protein SASC598J21_022070 [Snodgrassella alvi SCGC AB-598-J21]|uniref:Uncharacterized protein n=1 Tax=Snodgrassella alvi SCGC AB-598-J21 TaxID=1385367 RepID=A0A074VXU5_9NEIS|nr:hypothetical protein SASC598J21_022070 [Snodgrassella alvi SCGC AB-598-J21]